MSDLAPLRGLQGNPREVDGDALDADNPPRRVRDLVDLSLVEAMVHHERACDAMRRGVRIRDPHRISIRGNFRCAPGVTIDLDVILEGDVVIEEGAVIGPFCTLRNARIGPRAHVNAYSTVDDASIGEGSFVGPYARIRPGTLLAEHVQIGNFVEVKNSAVGRGSRINHLTFIGDASLGSEVTIGAGTITCNHNRVGVARTTIESGAYVGSGCELVAPIVIGEQATIGAGSTVTRDAPARTLTIARARQVEVAGWKVPESSESPS